MNEFETIARYFKPLTEGRDALLDDAAVLSVPPGFELVVTSDTLNAGTHFMADAAAGDIARKALRVNLSDLAAMGARPFAYQLNIAFPARPSEGWLAEFTSALMDDQKTFGIFCSGGDTTTILGSLSISITAMGLVPAGSALRRNGAKPGDHIILTGAVGDALIGLRVLRREIKTAADDYFIKAYYRPMPRFGLGVGIHAAADISDGLIADLGHICRASGCGARVELSTPPFSAAALKTGVLFKDLLTGGDDYELVLAVPPDNSGCVMGRLRDGGLNPFQIGHFVADNTGVRVFDKGQEIEIKKPGWAHF